MGARWYDSSLGRWISADVIVPSTAASSGGSAATLGYDDQARLTPLTVGFHETQFLSVVGEEDRGIADKGFRFQRGESEQAQSNYQWGPLNPQALNRYTFCLGNPLRYVDPTGHYQWTVVWQDSWGPLSRKKANEWTNSSADTLDVLLGILSLELLFFGPPGWVADGVNFLLIVAIDENPFHEGDYGSDTIYRDPDTGEYWRLVYYFDEDGNLLSYQCYWSRNGTDWSWVSNIDNWDVSDEEDENQ